MIQFVDGYMYILGNSLCNLRRERGESMKDHVLRRFSALCAAFVMLFSSIPVPAAGEGAGSTTPVCGLEEHRHTEECRQEDVLTCGKEEHVHTDACYPAPEPEPAPEGSGRN